MRCARFVGALVGLCFLLQILSAGAQSLAEAARKEAARRKALEEQGVQAKVIVGNPIGTPAARTGGNSGTPPLRDSTARSKASRSQPSLAALRATLQRLDREIAYGEERLKQLRSKLESARWQLPPAGRISRRSVGSPAPERLRSQIQELEAKVSHMRRERQETYENGRKAGYLPGELTGKGIIP